VIVDTAVSFAGIYHVGQPYFAIMARMSPCILQTIQMSITRPHGASHGEILVGNSTPGRLGVGSLAAIGEVDHSAGDYLPDYNAHACGVNGKPFQV
jgi:hypothetical protein